MALRDKYLRGKFCTKSTFFVQNFLSFFYQRYKTVLLNQILTICNGTEKQLKKKKSYFNSLFFFHDGIA